MAGLAPARHDVAQTVSEPGLRFLGDEEIPVSGHISRTHAEHELDVQTLSQSDDIVKTLDGAGVHVAGRLSVTELLKARCLSIGKFHEHIQTRTKLPPFAAKSGSITS